jgi:hypothetical protein
MPPNNRSLSLQFPLGKRRNRTSGLTFPVTRTIHPRSAHFSLVAVSLRIQQTAADFHPDPLRRNSSRRKAAFQRLAKGNTSGLKLKNSSLISSAVATIIDTSNISSRARPSARLLVARHLRLKTRRRGRPSVSPQWKFSSSMMSLSVTTSMTRMRRSSGETARAPSAGGNGRANEVIEEILCSAKS